jgi:hypothetical protein
MQDAQKDRPSRPQRAKRRGVPLWYIEPLSEATCLREAASAKAENDAGGLFQHPASGILVQPDSPPQARRSCCR